MLPSKVPSGDTAQLKTCSSVTGSARQITDLPNSTLGYRCAFPRLTPRKHLRDGRRPAPPRPRRVVVPVHLMPPPSPEIVFVDGQFFLPRGALEQLMAMSVGFLGERMSSVLSQPVHSFYVQTPQGVIM